MAIFSGVLCILVAFVPETHGPTLLQWRIAKNGEAPPPASFRKVVYVFKGALARPVIYLFTGAKDLGFQIAAWKPDNFDRTGRHACFALPEHPVRDPIRLL